MEKLIHLLYKENSQFEVSNRVYKMCGHNWCLELENCILLELNISIYYVDNNLFCLTFVIHLYCLFHSIY